LLHLLRSEPMTSLMSDWTSLPLLDDNGENENEDGEPEVDCYRIGKGCYTLVDDLLFDDSEDAGYSLNFYLFLGVKDWHTAYGGFISYAKKNEKREADRVSPIDNSAALVICHPDVCPFLKYVNSAAEGQYYYVITFSLIGLHTEEFSDDDDDDDEEVEEVEGEEEEVDDEEGGGDDDGDEENEDDDNSSDVVVVEEKET
uniref:Ofd1_CTDD domain-containing protein n=1 Tax=Gongylonema pulchrum TaxID=637853 RepID=A0A183E8D4_9BILA